MQIGKVMKVSQDCLGGLEIDILTNQGRKRYYTCVEDGSTIAAHQYLMKNMFDMTDQDVFFEHRGDDLTYISMV